MSLQNKGENLSADHGPNLRSSGVYKERAAGESRDVVRWRQTPDGTV